MRKMTLYLEDDVAEALLGRADENGRKAYQEALAIITDTLMPTRRPVVRCDDDCGALLEPETPREFRAALEHWREHGVDAGCAHGR